MPRVEGSEVLALQRAEVWQLLNDPDTLGASIPGCRGFERDGDAEHRYRTAIKVAVGMVTGVYEGTVSYVDIEEPERCTIVVAGKGDKGTIDGTGAITLAEHADGTEVGYRGDFKLTGPVAGVGQRMAPGVSRKMIVETLRNLEDHGARASEPASSEARASEEPGSAAPASTAATERGAEPVTSERPVAAESGAGGDDAFRPLAVKPGVAFAAGLVIGALIGGAIVALL